MNNKIETRTQAFALTPLFGPLIIATLLFVCLQTHASVTRVGNGDDGADLEGGRKVDTGLLIETRTKAIEKLERLDVRALPHLGLLLPELERSEIYLVNRDVKPKGERGPESSDGVVFARTFAEPHADTRFFPSALTLNQEQLVALHIHEALHRSLPASVREDEVVVSQITLALTSPDATFDRVKHVVETAIPEDDLATTDRAPAETAKSSSHDPSTGLGLEHSLSTLMARENFEAAPGEKLSSITYAYRSFFAPDDGQGSAPLKSLQSLQSVFYPFGDGAHALGLGIEFTYLSSTEQSHLGPLQLSARMRLFSLNGFDFGAFGTYSMNTLADDEFKNSALGRDVTTIGMSARRDVSRFYIENDLSVTEAGEAKHNIGGVEYTHSYGAITSVDVHGGAKLAGFELGGFGELLLSDYYRVNGGAVHEDSGRYRIVSIGPELSFRKDDFKFSLAARWIIDKTKDASLDQLGDIMGYGMGQGSITSAISFRF